MEIKDLAGLSKPLTKLVEVLAIGTGKLYEPTHIRRIAKAKADEFKIISDPLGNNLYLPTKYENGNLVIDNTKTEDLLVRAQNRFLFQEAQKQINIESVIGKAYKAIEEEIIDLKEEYIVSDKPVDKDWILRFFNSIEDISNEQMQEIWAKVLAGEIKQPKSFSLRTLEGLKNLSHNEAKLFEKYSNFMILRGTEYCIPDYQGYFNKYCSHNDLLLLEECGLIIFMPLTTTLKLSKDEYLLCDNTEIAVGIKSKTDENNVILHAYKCTNFGSDMCKIIKQKIQSNYLLDFAYEFKKENPHIKVSAYNINKINGNNVHISTYIDLLEDN